jgi:hypothetical protein
LAKGGVVKGEALVVLGQVTRQEGVGLVDGLSFGEAELRDEAVLVGLIGAFDTALGLGREGWDEEDAEAVAQLAEEAVGSIELAASVGPQST